MTLTLNTRLTRTDADGDALKCDVTIFFDIAGCTRPHEEDASYEFDIAKIEFDGGAPDDAPRPLTTAEIATLIGWFEDHYDEACREANDAMVGVE